MNDYSKCNELWNEIFQKADENVPGQAHSGNVTFDSGLEWLCKESNRILDFGCGTGTVLFLCSYYGPREFIGIDLSEQAIQKAELRSRKMKQGSYDFLCGGMEQLKMIQDETIDAVVLSNIVDNLYPEDAHKVLQEIKRVLCTNGKVLIKLNPFLTEDDIKNNKINVIREHVLDDGMILWNNTTEEWNEIISQYFTIVKYEDIYYEEYQQYNRMFLADK